MTRHLLKMPFDRSLRSIPKTMALNTRVFKIYDKVSFLFLQVALDRTAAFKEHAAADNLVQPLRFTFVNSVNSPPSVRVFPENFLFAATRTGIGENGFSENNAPNL